MIQTHIKYINKNDHQGNLKKAVTYLIENYNNINNQEVGKYEIDPSFFYMVQEYNSKDTTPWEAHQKYIDIQVILSGEEIMNVSSLHTLNQISEYDEQMDNSGLEGDVRVSMIMKSGDIAIFFPEDAHQPGLKTQFGTTLVKKCLFKVLI